MKIIKRSGAEEVFDVEKIAAAIAKANDTVSDDKKLTSDEINEIAEVVMDKCERMDRSANVEEIHDMVENQMMKYRAYEMARNYITYRFRRALVRKSNSTDEQILSLLEVLKNLEQLKSDVFFISYSPLPIHGLDSCPVRAYAIEGLPGFTE